MITTFAQNAFASFCYWADNHITSNYQAYRNHTSRLYYQADPELGPSFVAYASPFKQWVYDVGVPGAKVLTGISGSLSLVRGQSGMKVDYDNGRVILNAAVGKNLNISGSYAFKDFNFYQSDETEESLLSNTKYYLNSRTKPPAASGIEPYSFVTPCAFATVLDFQNDPFAMGGLENSKLYISLVVYAETSWQLNGYLSAFADAADKHFPLLTATGSPINQYGDIKTGLFPTGYSYAAIAAQAGTPGNLLYVESVKSSKISDRTDINPDVYAGIVQIEISKPRIT